MKKIILLTAILFSFLAISAWAEKKSNPVKSQPTPIKVDNPIQPEKATPQAFRIPWSSINCGGELNLSSTNYNMKVSTGQSAIGESQSDNYKMGVGFWYGPGIYCTSRPGDANGVGGINLTDIIYMVNHVFKGGPKPNPACRGDANGNGALNLTDIIYLVNRVFKGGPPPVKSGVCCL